MKCLDCGAEYLHTRQLFDYAELAGLSPREYTCWLPEVDVYECTCGSAPEIAAPEKLHLQIGLQLLRLMKRLKPSGFRFLRKLLRLKQTEFAKLLAVAPETISCWENGKQVPDARTEVLLRLVVLGQLIAGNQVIDEALPKGTARDALKEAADLVQTLRENLPDGQNEIEIAPVWMHRSTRRSGAGGNLC